MPVSQPRRVQIVDYLLKFGPERLTRNVHFREGLDDYVESGQINDAGNAILKRLRGLVAELELEDLDPRNEEAIRAKAVTLLKKYFSRAVPDESTRGLMQAIISDPDLPITGDDAARQDYMARKVPQMLNQMAANQDSMAPGQGMQARQRFNQNMAASMAAMGAAGGLGNVDLNDVAWQRQYFGTLVDQQFPHLNKQERERAIQEYIAAAPILWDAKRGLRLPEGCYIPLAFLALFVGLSAVMGLLLLVLLGQTYLMFGANNTEVGRALNATLLVMSVAGSLWVWLRRQTGSLFGVARLVMAGVFIAGIGLAGVQIFSVDADAITRTVQDDTESTVNAALLALSLGMSVILWLRRRIINWVWILLLALLVMALLLLADQVGTLDLGLLDFATEQAANNGFD